MNDSNEIICYCNNVKKSEVKKLIDSEPGIRFEELQKNLKAGTTCTACEIKREMY